MALRIIELMVRDDNFCGRRYDYRIFACGCCRLEKERNGI
jgi:hypothetical protein